MTAVPKTGADDVALKAQPKQDVAATAFRTLMRTQLDQARTAVEQNLRAQNRDDAWDWLSAGIDYCCVIERPLSDGPIGFVSAIMDALGGADDAPTARAQLADTVTRFENWDAVWADTVEQGERHALLEQSLIWLAICQLTAAGIRPERIAQAIGVEPPPQSSIHMRVRKLVSWAQTLSTKAWIVARPLVKRAGTAVTAIIATARAWLKAEQEMRRKAEEAATNERKRREAEAAQRRAERLQARAADGLQTIPIDGSALHGSVFGTWLALVVASWVSLLWGAIISLPFGVGAGIIGTFVGGLIVVPLWGTIWGFAGMSAASVSTERKLGFTPLPDDHPLAQDTRRFAAALDLPMPTFGTIDAYNAFAMGTGRNSATVAIGRPLVSNLTHQEALAVIGHELGHVASGDMRRMMLMRTFQNATVWYGVSHGLKQFARWIICWFTELGILAFSRRREYFADAVGAALAGKEAMIGALRTLERGPAHTEAENTHARFMIRGRPFSTHPSIEDRIAALEQDTYLRRLPIRRG